MKSKQTFLLLIEILICRLTFQSIKILMEDSDFSSYLVHCINISCTNFIIYFLAMLLEEGNNIPTLLHSHLLDLLSTHS